MSVVNICVAEKGLNVSEKNKMELSFGHSNTIYSSTIAQIKHVYQDYCCMVPFHDPCIQSVRSQHCNNL